MEFGDISTIENIDFGKYQTCRGEANREYFESFIDTILDPESTEDEYDDAVNDGLWDQFSHQYTLFSSTPLALYLILTKTTKSQRKENPELSKFIEMCEKQGNNGVYLTEKELAENTLGRLPIFSIPEIIHKFA